MAFLLSLVLGALPMFFFAWVIYWLDRYEKEPGPLLAVVFLWGALIVAAAAFLVNSLLGAGVYLFTHSEATANFATGSLIAPIVEELLKGLAVLVVFLLAHHEFDSILDGIVYAAVVALGFAATENVYYIYQLGYLENGLSGLLWTAFVRIFLVGWQHPFYTAFIGIGLAVARLSKQTFIRILAPLGGLLLAIILHATHNTISSVLQDQVGLLIGAFYDWSGWTLMFLFILWATDRERKWIVEQLREEVLLGNLTPSQYQTACSAWAQTFTRLGQIPRARYKLTARFYQICGELAYKKQQRAALGEEDGNGQTNSQIIDQLRAELARLSARVG